MKIAVLAAGAWGTALALAFSERHQVSLWTRNADLASLMHTKRENSWFLSGYPLPISLRVGTDLQAITEPAELLIVATPLSGFRATLRLLGESCRSKSLLWVCKGLEEGSAKLPHQIVADEFGMFSASGVLTGPSFAQELAQGLPLAITLASHDLEFSQRTALALHTPYLRIYANNDLIGSELGGAVKNVMAIATGICDGLGFGYNARAALMTRGLAEIARLGVALGGQPATFMGLAGMGDLILTCTGDLSRNRQVGLALASGQKLPQVLAGLGHVAEGVGAAREVLRLAAPLGIDMPIAEAVNAILHHESSPTEVVEKLLNRDPKLE